MVGIKVSVISYKLILAAVSLFSRKMGFGPQS